MSRRGEISLVDEKRMRLEFFFIGRVLRLRASKEAKRCFWCAMNLLSIGKDTFKLVLLFPSVSNHSF